MRVEPGLLRSGGLEEDEVGGEESLRLSVSVTVERTREGRDGPR